MEWLPGDIAVSHSERQSCRWPGYLFISHIINEYKEPLIALFINDLWVLGKEGLWDGG